MVYRVKYCTYKVFPGYCENTVFKPTRYCGVLEKTMWGPRIIVKFV
jgi:hypothetical protein